VANRWERSWHMKKRRKNAQRMERTRKLGAYGDLKRSRKLCLGGDGMKASEKSCVEEGDDGVTIIVGKGDFPATSVIERSKGAGISIWSVHRGKRCKRGGTGRDIEPIYQAKFQWLSGWRLRKGCVECMSLRIRQ